jgi:hypothetical protein
MTELLLKREADGIVLGTIGMGVCIPTDMRKFLSPKHERRYL